MTAKRLDGKVVAQQIRAELAARIQARTEQGYQPPGLTVIIVGDDPASQTYVRNKHRAASEVGIRSDVITLPAETTQAELLDWIRKLNQDSRCHGILVQLPLPRHIDDAAVLLAITPEKDVDCFHPENVGRVCTGYPRYYPCTPHGVIELVRRHGLNWAGQHAVVIGRSNIVGKPLAMMLLQKPTQANTAGADATVTVAHTRTADLAAICRQADVIVAAVGVPHLLRREMVKPGAIVVDVGTNMVDGKLTGDVHPEVAQVAGWLSPVPGGVGPMTITMLLDNTLRAAELIDGPTGTHAGATEARS